MKKLAAFVVLVMLGVPAAAQSQVAPEAVTVQAQDGLVLKGTYFNPGKPGPALMLLHQCNQDRASWAGFAAKAAARGYHVMTFDYRGYGESDGPRVDTLSNEERVRVTTQLWPGDVDTAFAHLMSRPGVDRARVGAAGASCGGGQSVALARRHPEVRALVLLSGGTGREPRDYVARAAGLPVLGVASLDDGPAVTQMRAVTGGSRHPATRFVEYQRAGHGTDMFRVEPRLEPMMLEWFDAHVRNAPDALPPPPAAEGTGPGAEFWAAVTSAQYARAREMFDAARKANPDAVLFVEQDMNLKGYEVLQAGDPSGAIVLFTMNVEAFPASANTYDSLSDAYLAAGNRVEALRFAEKALAALDADTRTPDEFKRAIRESAEKKIRELKKQAA